MSKLRICVGGTELEYEGATDLSAAELKDLLSHISEIAKVAPKPMVATETGGDPPPSSAKPNGHAPLHTNTIAAKLAVKSGTDLALAAAAQLQIIQGKESFNKDELLEEMRTATKYYKQSHGKNLDRSVKGLVGSHINQLYGNQYSLSASAIEELETKLAQ